MNIDDELVERVALALCNYDCKDLDLPLIEKIDDFMFDRDKNDYLEKAKTALRATFDWQPIETVPKDYTPVIFLTALAYVKAATLNIKCLWVSGMRTRI